MMCGGFAASSRERERRGGEGGGGVIGALSLFSFPKAVSLLLVPPCLRRLGLLSWFVWTRLPCSRGRHRYILDPSQPFGYHPGTTNHKPSRSVEGPKYLYGTTCMSLHTEYCPTVRVLAGSDTHRERAGRKRRKVLARLLPLEAVSVPLPPLPPPWVIRSASAADGHMLKLRHTPHGRAPLSLTDRGDEKREDLIPGFVEGEGKGERTRGKRGKEVRRPTLNMTKNLWSHTYMVTPHTTSCSAINPCLLSCRRRRARRTAPWIRDLLLEEPCLCIIPASWRV